MRRLKLSKDIKRLARIGIPNWKVSLEAMLFLLYPVSRTWREATDSEGMLKKDELLVYLKSFKQVSAILGVNIVVWQPSKEYIIKDKMTQKSFVMVIQHSNQEWLKLLAGPCLYQSRLQSDCAKEFRC